MRGKPWGEKESDPVRPHFDAQNPPVYEDVESLRWKVLVDNTGERVGTIENVEADEDTGRVEFIQIGRGGFLGFGAERFLVPLTAIETIDEKQVAIDRSLRQLDGVPPYEIDRMNDPHYRAKVRAWWSVMAPEPEAVVLEQDDSVDIEPRTPP